MNSTKKTARQAGLLYLMVVLTGIISFMVIPGKLIVWEDAAATYSNIVADELTFRIGMVSYLLCYTFFAFLPFYLYKLLAFVNVNLAKYMLILALISVPVAFANSQNQFNVVSLISGDKYLDVFSKEQLQSQVLLYLNQHDNGQLIISVFSGLWLFPFGLLVYKSGFLPKILGLLLMAGCFSYLVNFLGFTLMPDYAALGIASYVHLPASIGEIGICLWLLIMGVKERTIKNQKVMLTELNVKG